MNFSVGLPIGCQKVRLMHPNLHGKKYWLVPLKGPSTVHETNGLDIGCKCMSSLV